MKYKNTCYIPNEGTQAFYDRLTRYAARMVRPPDRYSFKRQLVMRLPKYIFDHLTLNGIMSERSNMQTIMHFAREAEENQCQLTILYMERHIMNATKTVAETKPTRAAYRSTSQMKPDISVRPSTST